MKTAIVILLFLVLLVAYRNERNRRQRVEAMLAASIACPPRSGEIYVASSRSRRVNVPVASVPAEGDPVWCTPPRGPQFRGTVLGPHVVETAIDGAIEKLTDGLIVIDVAGELHRVSLDDVVSL